VDLQILSKNTEVTEVIQDYVQKKIVKLTRYLGNIIEAKVEIREEKTKSRQDRFTVQVTLNSKGTLLRGEEKGENVYVATDAVAEVLARQIKRYKGKLYKKGRGVSLARQGSMVEGMAAEEKAEALPSVVRVKRFSTNMMSVIEATEQMELLGHDFFLFINADNNALNLLYRRKDGNYGIIEPELS